MDKIFTSCASAEQIMQKDAELLASLEKNPRPLLHHYNWQNDSATYGYFIKPEDFLNMEVVKNSQLSLARRPTGGGIIFHLYDLAFSVLIPLGHLGYSLDTLANYRFINNQVIQAIHQWLGVQPELLNSEPQHFKEECRHFCMAKPTKFDLMLGGKKVGGAAQRRTRWGYLHQGTIALAVPDRNFLVKVLRPGSVVAEAMQMNSYSLLGATPGLELRKAREELRSCLTDVFVSG